MLYSHSNVSMLVLAWVVSLLTTVTSGYSYIGVAEQLFYDDAVNYCQSNFGTELATILSAEDNQAVRDAASEVGVSLNTFVWIGLSDPLGDSNYVWATGEPLIYTNWDNREPNKFGGRAEDCVHLEPQNQGFRWNDNICDRAESFVCNLPPLDSNDTFAPTAEPTPPPTGTISSNSRKYIGVASELNYDDASEYCRSNFGTTLATIQSDTENQAVRDAATAAGVNTQRSIWIGLYDPVGSNNDFIWENGEPVGYTNWGPGEPNNWRGSQEDCVLMYWSTFWNDGTCGNTFLNFVCNAPEDCEPQCNWCRDGMGCMACRPFYQRVINDEDGLFYCEREIESLVEEEYVTSPCETDNCLGDAGAFEFCEVVEHWGCRKCFDPYFRKNNDFPCTPCSIIPHCAHCNSNEFEWGGCDVCEPGYSLTWDVGFGYKRCL